MIKVRFRAYVERLDNDLKIKEKYPPRETSIILNDVEIWQLTARMSMSNACMKLINALTEIENNVIQ